MSRGPWGAEAPWGHQWGGVGATARLHRPFQSRPRAQGAHVAPGAIPIPPQKGPGAHVAPAAILIPPQAPCSHSNPAQGPVRPVQSRPRPVAAIPIPTQPLCGHSNPAPVAQGAHVAPVSIPYAAPKGSRCPCGACGHSKPPQKGPGGPGGPCRRPGGLWGPSGPRDLLIALLRAAVLSDAARCYVPYGCQ